jgi:hypothetical protein
VGAQEVLGASAVGRSKPGSWVPSTITGTSALPGSFVAAHAARRVRARSRACRRLAAGQDGGVLGRMVVGDHPGDERVPELLV